ncbi:MAG: hypothetical protein ACE5FU_07445 [Nitrospinota bacterium]
MSRKNFVKTDKKTALWNFRINNSLKTLAETAIKHLGITKTEFLERSVKDELKNLAKTDPEIKKMVDATVRKVSAID